MHYARPRRAAVFVCVAACLPHHWAHSHLVPRSSALSNFQQQGRMATSRQQEMFADGSDPASEVASRMNEVRLSCQSQGQQQVFCLVPRFLVLQSLSHPPFLLPPPIPQPPIPLSGLSLACNYLIMSLSTLSDPSLTEQMAVAVQGDMMCNPHPEIVSQQQDQNGISPPLTFLVTIFM